jgi:hypothetical protein
MGVAIGVGATVGVGVEGWQPVPVMTAAKRNKIRNDLNMAIQYPYKFPRA